MPFNHEQLIQSPVKLSDDERRRIEYLTHVEKEGNSMHLEQMMLLLEMGFTDFNMNKTILSKCNGDVSIAAN